MHCDVLGTLTNNKLQSVNIDSVSIEIIHLDSFWKQNIQKIISKNIFLFSSMKTSLNFLLGNFVPLGESKNVNQHFHKSLLIFDVLCIVS